MVIFPGNFQRALQRDYTALLSRDSCATVQWAYTTTCLVPRPQYFAAVNRSGHVVRGEKCTLYTSPKSIDREGLGESRTGTRSPAPGFMLLRNEIVINFTAKSIA